MSTTTIRLPEELKARVAAAAKRTGTTAHSFMVDAITEKVAQEESRASFRAEADERYARIIASGETIPWAEMREYLKAGMSSEGIPLPKARKQNI